MRLSQRIQALEQKYSAPLALTLIFVGLKRNGDDTELTTVQNETGVLFERMPDESQQAFIARAREHKAGIVMLSEVVC